MNDKDVVLADQWIVSLYASPDTRAVDVRSRVQQVRQTLDVVVTVLNSSWDDVQLDVSQ